MAKTAPIIEVSNLSKHFRVPKYYRGFLSTLRNLTTREYHLIKAVDEINFCVNPGELVGYLGPNGAGKSTTIKMLTGLLVPTAGNIIINGFTPWKDRQKYVAGIGAVFGQRTTLWWDLPVIESLELFQYIYRVPRVQFQHNLAEYRRLLDLDVFLDKPVRTLSLGQRMRADLCAALLHEPALLFLDEPTIGLDVVAKERIRQFILHINKENGTTIILTTHDLSDVEKLCERVMIIDRGKLLFDGLLDTLRERFGGKRKLVVDFAEEYEDSKVNGAEIESREGNRVTYLFQRGEVTASDLIGRISARFRIQDLQVQEPEIEATIRRIYEENLLERDQGV
jgi:ABC-2 type transport system ATP-binding protein